MQAAPVGFAMRPLASASAAGRAQGGIWANELAELSPQMHLRACAYFVRHACASVSALGGIIDSPRMLHLAEFICGSPQYASPHISADALVATVRGPREDDVLLYDRIRLAVRPPASAMQVYTNFAATLTEWSRTHEVSPSEQAPSVSLASLIPAARSTSATHTSSMAELFGDDAGDEPAPVPADPVPAPDAAVPSAAAPAAPVEPPSTTKPRARKPRSATPAARASKAKGADTPTQTQPSDTTPDAGAPAHARPHAALAPVSSGTLADVGARLRDGGLCMASIKAIAALPFSEMIRRTAWWVPATLSDNCRDQALTVLASTLGLAALDVGVLPTQLYYALLLAVRPDKYVPDINERQTVFGLCTEQARQLRLRMGTAKPWTDPTHELTEEEYVLGMRETIAAEVAAWMDACSTDPAWKMPSKPARTSVRTYVGDAALCAFINRAVARATDAHAEASDTAARGTLWLFDACAAEMARSRTAAEPEQAAPLLLPASSCDVLCRAFLRAGEHPPNMEALRAWVVAHAADFPAKAPVPRASAPTRGKNARAASLVPADEPGGATHGAIPFELDNTRASVPCDMAIDDDLGIAAPVFSTPTLIFDTEAASVELPPARELDPPEQPITRDAPTELPSAPVEPAPPRKRKHSPEPGLRDSLAHAMPPAKKQRVVDKAEHTSATASKQVRHVKHARHSSNPRKHHAKKHSKSRGRKASRHAKHKKHAARSSKAISRHRVRALVSSMLDLLESDSTSTRSYDTEHSHATSASGTSGASSCTTSSGNA